MNNANRRRKRKPAPNNRQMWPIRHELRTLGWQPGQRGAWLEMLMARRLGGKG